MIREKLVSETMFNVKVNGSYSTNKPSFVSMELDHRLAPDAANLFMELEEKQRPPETGLIGFKLIAVYGDGRPSELTAEEILAAEGE